MIIIKNSTELKALLNEHNDLILPNEDVRIEYQVQKGELRNVECVNLYLENDTKRFDFNGRNFNGSDFNGSDFNGRDFNGEDFNGRNFNGSDFNGRDFNGRDFNGRNFNGSNFNGSNFNGSNFNGWNFNGKKVSYYAFFNCYGSMTCESYKGRRRPHADPVTLDGTITIVKPEPETITVNGKTYNAKEVEERLAELKEVTKE